MALTDNMSTICQYLVDNLAADSTLDFQDVWFGDQELIPRVPCATVDPGETTRILSEARRFVNCIITAYITVYHGQLDNRGTSLKSALQKGEATRDAIDAYQTLGGLVIFSYCSSVEVGTAVRGNNLLSASRISWEATTQVQLAS